MSPSSPDYYNTKLIYDCGIAINTQYGPNGSSSQMDYVKNALYTYFGFKDTASDYYSNEYTDLEWKNILKSDLDLGRPIFYTGYDDIAPNTSDHAWIIDGYNSLDQFWCNWGWGGSWNAFYYLNNLNPYIYVYAGNFVAILNIEPVMPNCVGINGGSAICSSGTSFNVPGSSLPPGATVTWNKSDNITIVSSQPSNPCTFQANGTGSGWIEATVNYNGSATLDRKDVLLGPPTEAPVFEVSEIISCDGLYYRVAEENNQIVTWDVTPPLSIVGSNVGFKCTFMATGSGYAGPAWITATAQNNCGSISTDFQVYVECPEQYELLLTPNPAADEVEVSFKSETSDQLQSMLTPDKQLNVKIYNNQGNIIQNKKMAVDKFKLSTSNLKDGSYIVEVEIDKKIYSKILLVKH